MSAARCSAARSRSCRPITRTSRTSARTIARKWYDVDGVDDDHRPRHLVGGARRPQGRAGKGPDRHQHRCGLVRPHRARPARETGAHWVYDTYALAHVTGDAMVKAGGDSWYFLTADYAFGHALERDVSAVVKAAGGKVLGAIRHPLSHAGLLVLPAAGAGLQGQDHRPRQCRPRHDQLDQAGGANSASSRPARSSPACSCSPPTCSR